MCVDVVDYLNGERDEVTCYWSI